MLRSVSSDTVFNSSIDTVTLEKERLSIRYVKVKDKIYLSGECKGDTIIREIPVRVDSVKPPDVIQVNGWWRGFWWGLLIGAVVAVGLFVGIKLA